MRRGVALSLLVWCALASGVPAEARPPRAQTVANATKGASGGKRRPKAKSPEPATQGAEQQAAAKGAEAQGSDARADGARAARGPTRIDFDDRLIQGQTNKSGAVYLFDRKELQVRSMVKQRSSFRDQIVRDVLAE
jgi:hypothetical protein